MTPEQLDELERGYLPVNDGSWIPTVLKDKIYVAFPALLALARDGVRYRHVREHPEMLLHLSNKEFDAAIDAAMKEST